MASAVKKACIAELLNHPKKAYLANLAEHERQGGYGSYRTSNLSLWEELRQRGDFLRKEDALLAASYDDYFMAAPDAWDNFDKFVSEVRQRGDEFTAADFTAPLLPGGHVVAQPGVRYDGIIDHAVRLGKLDKVFTAHVWNGREEDMLDLYFRIDKTERAKIDVISLKKEMALQKGGEPREVVLARAGVSIADIHEAVRQGEYDALAAKLKAAGEKFRKTDIFLVTEDGAGAFDKHHAFVNLPATAAYLKDMGEPLELADFSRPRAGKGSLLDRAVEMNDLSLVFAASIWADRLDEMDKLWARVPREHRHKVDFDHLRREAATRAFENAVPIDRGLTKIRLLTPFTGIRTPAGEAPAAAPAVMPLSLSVTWSRFREIQSILRAKNQALTLNDLRGTDPADGASFLAIGARLGHFEAVLAEIDCAGQLTAADLTAKSAKGRSLLDELAQRRQLALVFKPENWQGRVRDLAAAAAAVPQEHRGQVDLARCVHEANRLTLLGLPRKPPAPRR
jgi:hypothetical protein